MFAVLEVFLFLLCVGQVISTDHCPPNSGIYLMYKGDCYPDESYFWDSSLWDQPNNLMCALPDSTLTTGEWVRVNSNNAVDCTGSSRDPFVCRHNANSPYAALSIYRTQTLQISEEGLYKCCLPSSCSTPGTNVIYANIFRYVQISSFTATFPSDIEAVPQQYTLHCIKTGYADGYDFAIYYNGGTEVASGTNCRAKNGPDGCSKSRKLIHSSNNTYDYPVTITWDTVTISSGSFSATPTGDHSYTCELVVHGSGGTIRTRALTVKVPGFTPSFLSVVKRTTSTITVSWTPDPSDADGYVVYATSGDYTVTRKVVGGSATLKGLSRNTRYNITVRAYQKLLGPPSTISVRTLHMPGLVLTKRDKIIIGVTVSIIAIIMLIVLVVVIVCCCRQKKNYGWKQNRNRYGSTYKIIYS